MATVFIGIDPGKSGAIAIWRPAISALTLYDAPLLANTKGKTETDLHGLLAILRIPDGDAVVLLEAASPRPGEGSVSAFTFGKGYGAIQMAIAAQGHEVRYVTPSVWKKHFGLIFPKGTGKPIIKAASRALAQQRFPAMAQSFARVKDDGRAEAALMAIYAVEAL